LISHLLRARVGTDNRVGLPALDKTGDDEGAPMNQVSVIVLVAAIAAVAASVAVRTIDHQGGGQCDVHPRLSDTQAGAIKDNIDRARSEAYRAALSDGKTKDQANSAAEDAAFDTFVHDLRPALSAEYLRHREALDGCF
jgi:cobalamin biosynthesis protein CobT